MRNINETHRTSVVARVTMVRMLSSGKEAR